MRYDLTFEIEGDLRISGRTEEDAELNMRQHDFGDLRNADWSVMDVEQSCDGERNDMVYVTYHVTGLCNVCVYADSLEEALEEAGPEITDAYFGGLEDMESSCCSHDIREEYGMEDR
jgi:hypothetical protein